MNADDQNLRKFFAERHIILKEDWLEAFEEYFQTKKKPLMDRTRIVFDQWLRSDLKDSTEGQYEAPKVKAFTKKTILQIVDINDISISEYQKKKNKDRDIDVETPLFEINDYQARVQTTRMYKLTLTDGKSTVCGVEHEFMKSLTGLCPGGKLLICGTTMFRNNILMLTPTNCQVLGGTVLPVKDEAPIKYENSNGLMSAC
ncbi:RecQ-mediated genome instability protein 1 [Aphelenchoides bicaudatus]|nr:RecQ-mediated genome instability protein 1 [Aphelenchoides bicaudatus]